MTVDELAALSEDDSWFYELVEGVLVRMPPSSYGASAIASTLLWALVSFVRAHRLGRVTGEQGGYVLDSRRPRQTQVAPDVGFVRAERDMSLDSPASTKAFPGAPDLAVEVAAPRQSRPAMAKKARLYRDAGTRLVWIVWPRQRQVDVWHPGDTESSTTLEMDGSLDGEDVAPGFMFAVADLFA